MTDAVLALAAPPSLRYKAEYKYNLSPISFAMTSSSNDLLEPLAAKLASSTAHYKDLSDAHRSQYPHLADSGKITHNDYSTR